MCVCAGVVVRVSVSGGGGHSRLDITSRNVSSDRSETERGTIFSHFQIIIKSTNKGIFTHFFSKGTCLKPKVSGVGVYATPTVQSVTFDPVSPTSQMKMQQVLTRQMWQWHN